MTQADARIRLARAGHGGQCSVERGQTHRRKAAQAAATAGGRRRAGPRPRGLQLVAAHRSARQPGSVPEAPKQAQQQQQQLRSRPSASTSASSPPITAPTRIPSSKACSTGWWPSSWPRPSGRTWHYRVTILNSAAVNAFALPTGQLYVTRGLIALANDTSELASVLSHEMSHVIARHAAMREDQARQVALVEPRRARRAERSGNRRAGARQIQDHARELLARAGIRGRRHRRRHRRARRATIPTARCGSSPRWAAMPS